MTIQAHLSDLTGLINGSGLAEPWAAQVWQQWLLTDDRGNGELTGQAARAYLSTCPLKTVLVEMATTNSLCLQKLRQLEHSLYFLEGRSELGFGLWHELLRVWHRHLTEWELAKSAGDLPGMMAAQAAWKSARRDYLIGKWQAGCMIGTAFSCSLMTWKFK